VSDSLFDQLRSQFQLPGDKIYLDGNSLGALPAATPATLANIVTKQWGTDLIASWNTHDWIDLPLFVGNQIAKVIGATENTVVCCDNLSINLYKAILAALELNPTRKVVCVEEQQFPSDNYIAAGVSQLLGEERCSITTLSIEGMTPQNLRGAAVLVLSHVDYKTGSLRNMAQITANAHAAGALVVWDLAHSAGVIDIDVTNSEIDFAVGCTYKFLNGGPGAPGYLFVHPQHQSASNPISGWMGHARLFDFEAKYEAAPGIKRFLTGTQSVLALSAVSASLSVFEGLTMQDVRARSLALTKHFITRWKQSSILQSHAALVTPIDDAQRGSQVSLALESAFAVSQALIADGVIVDFREPNIVRLGFSPLYNTFSDADQAISSLEAVLASERFRLPQFQIRSTVT